MIDPSIRRIIGILPSVSGRFRRARKMASSEPLGPHTRRIRRQRQRGADPSPRLAQAEAGPVDLTGPHGPKPIPHKAVTLSRLDRQSSATASRRRHADANVIAGCSTWFTRPAGGRLGSGTDGTTIALQLISRYYQRLGIRSVYRNGCIDRAVAALQRGPCFFPGVENFDLR